MDGRADSALLQPPMASVASIHVCRPERSGCAVLQSMNAGTATHPKTSNAFHSVFGQPTHQEQLLA